MQTIHEWTGPTGVHFREIAEPSGTYYREGTPRPVIDALESARVSGARIRLFLGDPETGRCWGDEHNVTGRVGRTAGRIPKPILLHSRRSMGGGIISTDHIVRLMIRGRDVYRHPGYSLPVYRIADMPVAGDWPVEVFECGTEVSPTAGSECARFKTFSAAVRWIAFMRGERGAK